MSCITKMKGTIVLLFGLILIVTGCSKQNSNSSTDPDTGKHNIAGWANADTHGAWAKKSSTEGGFASCQECHGSDFSGGNSKTACSTCHTVNAPHPAVWRTGVRTHQTTDESNAPVCAGCHTNGANSPIVLTSPAPAGTAPGCFNNTLCHGQGHAAGWANPDQHGASAKSQANGFSTCQSCHGIDFAGGTSLQSCLMSGLCHGATVTSPHPVTPWRTSGGSARTHTDTNVGNASVCADCHTGGALMTTLPTPTNPATGTPGCFNATLCHGQMGHAVGWKTPDQHGAAAKLAPNVTNVTGFSTCQTCHAADFTGGTSTISCLNTAGCHGVTVSSPHAAAPWVSSLTSTMTHTTTDEANATVCGFCHSGGGTHAYATPPGLVGCFDNTLCHAAAANLGCVDCHLSIKDAPNASIVSGGTVTRRAAIVPSFSLASRHIRSRTASPAVTNNDCGVCHMEGYAADGSINVTYHKNGYIELRDPDTGVTIKGVTHSGTTSAEGAYTSTGTDARPVRFSRNLGSIALEADTQAIMVNQCLKCHDADGANSALARVPGAASGLQPFGAAIAANPGSNVLDVAAQFNGANRAFHPILVRNNAPYTNAGGTRMASPWNGGATKTGTAAVYGPLMTCWDCHAPNGASGTLTTSGVHGGTPNGADAVPLRGNVFTNSATATTGVLNLCVNCHVVTGNTTNHGTGSGITSSTNGSMTYFSNRCYFCHSTANTTAKPARPIPSGDVHGYTAMDFAGTAFPSATRGYVFFRRAGLPVAVRVGGTGTATCGTGSGICSNSMGTYTPGGAY